jgi:hypothetical protein
MQLTMLPVVKADYGKPIKIPEWAPPALVSRLADDQKRAAKESAWDQQEDAILRQLVTDRRMEAVWRRLMRRSAHGDTRLCWECCAALAAWRAQTKLTRAEARKLHLSVAKCARQLRELLQTDEGLQHLEWYHYLDEFGLGSGRVMGEPEEDSFINEVIELPRWDVLILRRLEDNAVAMAETSTRRVPQPNAPDARVRFVAYHLSDYFERSYGTPLHAIVAIVTSVICDADVGEDHVRGWIRTRNKSERKRETPTGRKPQEAD